MAEHWRKAVYHVDIRNSTHRENMFIHFIRIHKFQLIQWRNFGQEVCITHNSSIHYVNNNIFLKQECLEDVGCFVLYYCSSLIDASCYLKARRLMRKCNFHTDSFYHVQKLIWPCHRAQYGAPGDFDEWAEIIHDQSWAWKDFSRLVYLACQLELRTCHWIHVAVISESSSISTPTLIILL